MNKEMLISHPWFEPGAAAVFALPLALLIQDIGAMVLKRVTRGAPVLHTMLIHVQPAVRLALPLAALQLVWQVAPDDLRFMDIVRRLNGLLLFAAATGFGVKSRQRHRRRRSSAAFV
jgi:hypothetical protein